MIRPSDQAEGCRYFHVHCEMIICKEYWQNWKDSARLVSTGIGQIQNMIDSTLQVINKTANTPRRSVEEASR